MSLSCQHCAVPIEPKAGRGRPRINCTDCAPVRDWTKYAEKRRANRKPNPPRPVLVAECPACSVRFETLWRVQKFCTELCKQRSNDLRKYERRGQFSIPRSERLAIYQRDQWTCQLCLEPVTQGLNHLDNWAPSLDHILPRSLGGHDGADNLRLAHRWCNIIRGDGSRDTSGVLSA